MSTMHVFIVSPQRTNRAHSFSQQPEPLKRPACHTTLDTVGGLLCCREVFGHSCTQAPRQALPLSQAFWCSFLRNAYPPSLNRCQRRHDESTGTEKAGASPPAERVRRF